MIAQMSPLTRKIVAVGLAVLMLLILLQFILLPLIGAIGDERDELAALRARRARLTATAHRLLPDASTMPPGLAIVAPDAHGAASRFQALLAGSARTAGASLTQSQPKPLGFSPLLLGSDLVATGDEVHLAGFISLAEHGTPTIRFEHWRLAGGGAPTTLRFEGRAIVAWQPAS